MDGRHLTQSQGRFELANKRKGKQATGMRFGMVALSLFMLSPRVFAQAPEPQNLLIIQTDEHHFNTLGCYGGTIVGTPNIDWIANNGALCTSFYATTPVCSPSRASLVSGLYPQKTPVTQNNIPLNDDVITFAEMLRKEGVCDGLRREVASRRRWQATMGTEAKVWLRRQSLHVQSWTLEEV